MAIKGKRIFKVAFADHLFCEDTGHLLDCTIPGNHPPFPIDRDGRIREKIDYAREALLALPSGVLLFLLLG